MVCRDSTCTEYAYVNEKQIDRSVRTMALSSAVLLDEQRNFGERSTAASSLGETIELQVDSLTIVLEILQSVGPATPRAHCLARVLPCVWKPT